MRKWKMIPWIAIIPVFFLIACSSDPSEALSRGGGLPDGDIEGERDAEEAAEEEIPDPGYDLYFGSLRYETEATGFFRVEEIDGQWWLITPEGHPFFSTGMNVLNYSGTATKDGVRHYQEACDEKYESREAWAEAQFDRCLAWGWNTVGCWSDWALFKNKMPYTIIISIAGANWIADEGRPHDYFSEVFRDHVQQRMTDAVTPNVDDPYLIGYFLDNELHWGRDHHGTHLFPEYMSMPVETSQGKARLMEFLKERYSTIEALTEDFETEAASWEELVLLTELKSRNTDGALETRSAWTGLVGEAYFGHTDEAFRAIDSNHLNLGARFVSQIAPREAIEAAGRYVDVMTINFYDLAEGMAENLVSWDPEYLQIDDYLREHYEAGGKPIMISEWGFRARDSGLPNSYPPIFFYPILETQEDRADAYEAKFRGILARPWFVGQHWFLYADQPPEGRFDGEDNNFGIITEKDEPYQALVDRSAMMHREIYKRLP